MFLIHSFAKARLAQMPDLTAGALPSPCLLPPPHSLPTAPFPSPRWRAWASEKPFLTHHPSSLSCLARPSLRPCFWCSALSSVAYSCAHCSRPGTLHTFSERQLPQAGRKPTLGQTLPSRPDWCQPSSGELPQEDAEVQGQCRWVSGRSRGVCAAGGRTRNGREGGGRKGAGPLCKKECTLDGGRV